jgi:Fur family ferric uptake transcriptional regulator
MRPPAPPPRPQAPTAARRPGKRDLIVDVFLRQEGALSADDLVALARRDHQGISRATVYRSLQWMVEAGIARKVDAGEGRVRFGHSYRHPRHFHLMCKQCSRSFEFVSGDIETLIDEVAAARGFAASQSVLQVYGTCERCRLGQPQSDEESDDESVFARDALRVAIATVRSGLEFYTRAARLTQADRDLGVFLRLADDERDHLTALETRYKALLDQDPQLESRPTFLFLKGAANGLFAKGVEELAAAADHHAAARIGTRCERRAHVLFTRCGDRFGDPEARRVFQALADTKRKHLTTLLREFGSPASTTSRASTRRTQPGRPRR